MNGKKLVTKALAGFNKAKDLLQKAIDSDTKEIGKIKVEIVELQNDQVDYEDNVKYATKVLGKLTDLLS